MTFLQPFILLGLPLVLTPILIHLLNRRRYRTNQWAAMRFLVMATRSSTSRAKLKQFLILLFRTLAVLCLLLFLGRPLVGPWLGWMSGGAPDVALLLLDRSASMERAIANQAGGLRDEALRRLIEVGRPFDERTEFILIDSADALPKRLPNIDALRDNPQTEATDAAADIPAMVQSALDWIEENAPGSTEIWIASDLQQSNWNPDDARWKLTRERLATFPQPVEFRLMRLEAPEDRGLSVSVSEATRDGDQLQIEIRIRSNGPIAAPIPVTIEIGGVPVVVEAAIESELTILQRDIPLEEDSPGGWGAVRLPEDPTPRDNVAYFVYGSGATGRVAVVAQNDASARLFQVAATVLTNADRPSEWVDPLEAAALDWNSVSLLVWIAPLPSGPEAEAVELFVREGGVALFLPPESPGIDGLRGIQWGATETAESGPNPFRIGDWSSEDGPTQDTEEGLRLPLNDITVGRRQQILGSSATLASFADGEAFLTRNTLGAGALYFLATRPESAWSDLGSAIGFVPILKRLLTDGARRLDPVKETEVGALDPVDSARDWRRATGDGNQGPALSAGVYQDGEHALAVNRPEAEDDTAHLTDDDVNALFAEVPIAQTAFDIGESSSRRVSSEIWRVFLALMLLFLLGESLLILPPKRLTNTTNPT